MSENTNNGGPANTGPANTGPAKSEHVFLADRIKHVRKPIMLFVYTALGATFLIGMVQQYF